jgi:IclR family transcriptional regulator, acetate operon repressor
LRAELEAARGTGIARTREEHSPGICGLARIAALDGEVLGAFSVAIPAVRYNAEIERRAIDLLVRTTALLTAI